MRHIFLILLVAASPLNSWASESNPYGVTVGDLVKRATAENEVAYMSLAAKRCAAFIHLVNGILQRDTGRAPFEGQVDNLLSVSMSLETMMARERGAADDSIKGIGDRVIEDYARHRENYVAWMTYNYDFYGDYWGTDPKMAAELESCKVLIVALES